MEDYYAAVEARRGFIPRTDVLAVGDDDRLIRRRLASRTWTRVRNGAYCTTPTWQALDPVEQHRLRCRAVIHAHGDAVALSHVSGLLMHEGCEVWGIDLTRVHVTRRDGRSGSSDHDVVHHEDTGTTEVELVDGLPVLSEVRCVVDTIACGRLESGLVIADSALRAGRVSPEMLRERHLATRQNRGGRTVHLTLRLADKRAESVGESRSRFLFWSQGLPQPEVQYVVLDADGRLVGTTDLAWPAERLLFEFDGRVKYGRLLRPGQDPGDAVWAEKKREDALRRATGFAMERATWADLSAPTSTARRTRQRMGGPGAL